MLHEQLSALAAPSQISAPARPSPRWTRVRNARIYLETTELVQSLMPNMKFPFITFHSARDTMVEPESSQKLFDLTPAETDKTFERVDTMCAMFFPLRPAGRSRACLGRSRGADEGVPWYRFRFFGAAEKFVGPGD